MTDRFYPVGLQTRRIEPRRAYEGDAGFDLYTTTAIHVKPGVITSVPTGWGVRLEMGEFGMICPRSGFARNGITVVNSPGIIDAGYQGELVVLLTSLAEGVELPPATAVAQLVICQHRGSEEKGLMTREDKGFGSSDQ